VNGLARTLMANGPAPAHADELMLFGRFVGSWDAEWTGVGVDGTRAERVPGEVHFGWALGGRAVQDTWVVPGPREWGRGEPAAGFYGTTVRFYDPDLGAWRSTWIDPPNGVVRRFIGRPWEDDIVLRSEEQWPHLLWRFTEIADDSFHWTAEVRMDEGSAWMPHQDIRLRRTSG
jgi:hypothetical protein